MGSGRPPTTRIVLETVRLPNTFDWLFRQGLLKSPNAKRLAMICIDHWNGREPTPSIQAPEKPKAAVTHDRAAVASWTFGGVAAGSGAAAMNMAAVPFVPVAAGSAMLAAAALAALWSSRATAREYRARVVAAREDHDRRNRTDATVADLFPLKAAATHDEGRLAMAAVLVATDIADSPAWTSALLDDHHGRIDLDLHIAQIAYSGGEISRLRDAMALPTRIDLTADTDIAPIVEKNEEHLTERLETLALRVRSLLDYRGGIQTLEPLIAKRAWIENQPKDVSGAGPADELATSDLDRATDDINSGTRAAVEYLVEQAKRTRFVR
ncbi:hypothetical protein [Nocardia mangyaensis]|uniref:hypothetical protein n=1 Tax=Nocardia mangyaensis TaxID=2213200 RepID=UPI00267450EB|nr:hypothetical protein [Nocardia mangyaensis]MDO3647459.1 hypothetical protein [Nocardia mangyaensis]